MDLSFFRRAEQRFAQGSAARLDFGLLVAMLRAHQSHSAAARAEARGATGSEAGAKAALVELVLGGPGWRGAVGARMGCFNPAYAQAFACAPSGNGA